MARWSAPSTMRAASAAQPGAAPSPPDSSPGNACRSPASPFRSPAGVSHLRMLDFHHLHCLPAFLAQAMQESNGTLFCGDGRDHSVAQARKWTTALRKHSHLTVVGALTGDAFSSVLKKICQLVITDPPPFPARRFLSVGGLLLVVGFVLFVLDGDQQKAPLPSSATREIPADLPPDATASGGPVRDVSSARAIASKSLSPDGIISTEEQRLIEKGLLKIEAEMRKVETANQTVVYDREVPGGYAVIIRMTPPTTDQMGGVSNILSAAMQNFVTGSQAGERMRERGLWMIDQYANYPKRVKMLSFSGTSDGARALLMEYFVDDEKLVMRDAVGRYRIPNPPRAVVREDSDLTKPDSWGARRYSHVFTVVGKSPGEGPGGTDR